MDLEFAPKLKPFRLETEMYMLTPVQPQPPKSSLKVIDPTEQFDTQPKPRTNKVETLIELGLQLSPNSRNFKNFKSLRNSTCN